MITVFLTDRRQCWDVAENQQQGEPLGGTLPVFCPPGCPQELPPLCGVLLGPSRISSKRLGSF